VPQLLPDLRELLPVPAADGLGQSDGREGALEPEEPRPPPMVSDQVPDAGLVDQAVRIDGVGAGAVIAPSPVPQSQPSVCEDGVLKDAQIDRRLLPVGRALPSDGVDQDAAAHEIGIGTMRAWQRSHHLAQGGADGLTETQIRMRRAREQDEQGPRLVCREAGDVGAITPKEGDPASRAPHRIDGNTGCGQRPHVSHDGADGDLEPLRELGRGHLPTGLQQKHDRQQPVGSHESRSSRRYTTQGVIYPV